ncbi:MAG: ABC transporter ATP-binding protein [Beijerinckiaceae bacterium]
MMRPALSIRNLTVTDRSGVKLVDDVTLTIPQCGIFVLIGETGSGKSLVAAAALGLLPEGLAATGLIQFSETASPVNASDKPRLMAQWRETVALLPQEPSLALDPTMRAGRQLALAGVPEHDLVPALARVDLEPETARLYPHMLSGGMAQRVLIAAALAGSASVLIADEPTKGLDGARVQQVTDRLHSVNRDGRALLVITHDMQVARAIGGEIAVMRDGRIVETGKTEQVLGQPEAEYTRDWIAADPTQWQPCRRCVGVNTLPLAAHHLGFAWPGQKPLFSNIDIHVPAGGVLAIVGPSGSGKSTLGNVLLGLNAPTSGHVHWLDIDPHRNESGRSKLRQRYQKLHQDPVSVFIPGISIQRQLERISIVKPDTDLAATLPPLLDQLKLKPNLLNRTSAEISGGEAQRLALVRLLLFDPAVIVADEPTSRLDPIVQRETMNLLRACVDERGLGLVLISHDRALVDAVSDEVIRIG